MQVILTQACVREPGRADETNQRPSFFPVCVALPDSCPGQVLDALLDTGDLARLNKINSVSVIRELTVLGGETLISHTLR